jgi:hypothetical protein
VLVLGRQTREGVPSRGVVLYIRDTVLNLALVLWGPGATRQDGAPVMFGEAGQLGVKAYIEPVGLQDCRREVVKIEGPRDTAEGTLCVLQPTDELLGIPAGRRPGCRPFGRSSKLPEGPRDGGARR